VSVVIAFSVSMVQCFVFCMCVCCLILMLTCFILTCLLTNIVSVKCVCVCVCVCMYVYVCMHVWVFVCIYVINHFSVKSATYVTDIYKILQVYGWVTRNRTQVFAFVKHIGDGMVGIKNILRSENFKNIQKGD
jgi:hypothetical protein